MNGVVFAGYTGRAVSRLGPEVGSLDGGARARVAQSRIVDMVDAWSEHVEPTHVGEMKRRCGVNQ